MVIKQPDGPSLLALERQVRESGTALEAAALQGSWRLQQVWSKGASASSPLSNWALQGLQARLELEPLQGPQLRVSNAVNLGPLELRFIGEGHLKGRRPLLMFSFQSMVVKAWGRCWMQRTLPAPAPKRFPFFALIARSPDGWLAARGRGGGLALWTHEPLPDAN